MKVCRWCKGSGHVVKFGIYGVRKVTDCKKCYGKGMK